MINRIINFINENKYVLIHRKSFNECGIKVKIINPLNIQGRENISIKDKVIIQYKSWITALPLTGSSCRLEIGAGCSIGHFNHIFATKEILIGSKVLTADRVYISDNLHNYSNPFMPILDQGIRQVNSVRIGEGTWIGENACIIGVSIGKNCVVGANAVVTKDIPDYSVVVGIPEE